MIRYLLLRDNIKSGPFSVEELKVTGIRSTDQLWIEGRSRAWRYADEIKELQPFVHHASAMNMNDADISGNILPIHDKEDSVNKTTADNNFISTFLPTEPKQKSIEEINEERERFREKKPDDKKDQGIGKSRIDRKGYDDFLQVRPVGIANPENNGEIRSSEIVIKVIIADDHTLFREGVKMALAQKNGVKIVGEAENGNQLLHLLKHNIPDVILLDIQMPVMDGITALAFIRKRYPDMKVIMLSMHNDRSMVSKLMESGANAYLTKTADSGTIYEAIKTCFTKGYYFNDLTNMAMLEVLHSKNKISEKIIQSKFESFTLPSEMMDIKKKSTQPASKKIKKRTLVAVCFILLVVSGIMASMSIMRQSKKIKVALPQHPKQVSINPLATTLHKASAPSVQPIDTVQKMNVTDSTTVGKAAQVSNDDEKSSLAKTKHLLNEKKDSVDKHARIKKTVSLKVSALPPIAKSNHNAKPDNDSLVKLTTSDDAELKVIVRNNIRNLVSASINDYYKEPNGGLSNIELTVDNRSGYTLDLVTIEIHYMLSDSILYKTEILNFQGIAPQSSQVIKAPKSSEGVKIEYQIMSIRSKDLEL